MVLNEICCPELSYSRPEGPYQVCGSEWRDDLRNRARIHVTLLDPKMRELIALAVAAYGDSCIAIHTEAALKHGAAREEIIDALGVAAPRASSS